MSEAENRSPETQEPLSPRRRAALVTYLSILFAVAFLFVAIVMVMETRRLKTMNEELKDSSQKTSASLTNNINALQEENRRLSEDNDAKSARIGELEAAAAAEATAAAELQTRLDAAAEELEGLKQELQEQKTRLDEAAQRAEDAVRVSELLHQAMAADESGSLDRLRELLDQIEPLKELLSESEQAIWEELKLA